MDDILDYEKGGNGYVDYLFIQEYQLDGIVDVLTENDVIHRVKQVKHLDDVGFIPIPAETLLNRSDYIIQVQKKLHQKVDYIMAENPELLQASEEVRKVFLANTLDKDGLVDILLFPEEWLEGDDLLAIDILAKKGITIPVSEYDHRREGRENERVANPKSLPAGDKSKISTFGIVLIVIFLILSFLLGGSVI